MDNEVQEDLMSEGYELQVAQKYIHGVPKIIPLCQQSKIFCKLLNQSFFTERNIKIIKELGYSFKVIQEEIVI